MPLTQKEKGRRVYLSGGRHRAQRLVQLSKVALEILLGQLAVWGHPGRNLNQLRIPLALLRTQKPPLIAAWSRQARETATEECRSILYRLEGQQTIFCTEYKA